MFYIRTTKTSSGATAVQIVRYKKRKVIVVKHVGSAHNKQEEEGLKKSAAKWIEKETNQTTLFSDTDAQREDHPLKNIRYIGFRYTLVYETLYQLCKFFGFHWFRNNLLLDLVISRVLSPGSKLQSIEFMKEFIGIEHTRQELYRQLPRFVKLKSKVEAKVLEIAQKEFGFKYSLIFYDVTTLYFETSETDVLRQYGFSKDNKFNQPQIVLGLLVTDKGFPIGYQIFEGNKFEGHTIVPIIKGFKKKHNVKTFTVIADAAMISAENIKALRSAGLHYIVGARVANLSMENIKSINTQLNQQDKRTVRIETELGDLICEFSAKRYAKDKREMERGIAKAESILKNPGRMKRVKFISSEKNRYELNLALIEKTKLLLGIKGYYTNLLKTEVEDHLTIEHYHNLWHVEQAFRITKSDLQVRPIYHYKHEAIEVHVLICFMALALCKFMEIKTGKSTKSILKLLKSVTDATLLNTQTGEKITLRIDLSEEVKNLLNKIVVFN